MGDVAKELAKMWNAVSDKSKYNKKAEADKQRYLEEMSAWNDKNGN